MKKPELRKIIRESIKELMTEQSYPWAPNMGQGQFVLSQVNDAIAALISQDPNMIIGLYQDSQGNIIQPPTAVISFTHCICVAQAEASGAIPSNFPGAGVQCHTYPQLLEDGSGNGVSILNDVGGYPSSYNYSMVQLAADPSLGFYDTMVGPNGANAGCQAFNQSQQVLGCRFPNACNYDPAATAGSPSQYCTWGPAGPNYSMQVQTPHPCPSTPTNISANPTQLATQGKQLTTPIPSDPSDPGMKRMKDLAFKGKR